MTFPFRATILCGLVLSTSPVWAVYAPVPEQEQGKNLTVSVRAGISHDSNLFGAPNNEVSSTIYTLAPRVVYTGSLTDQTFLSSSYGVTVDRFENRPGDKTLDSHDAMLRIAHAFQKTTTLDVTDLFSVARNPESLISTAALVPPTVLNPDQSYTRNQIDGRFETPLAPKVTLELKARSVLYDYRNDAIGHGLDRIENLYGIGGDYAILPEAKGVAEYRHQDVFYRKEGRELKNKNSDYLMAGADYFVAKKMSLSGRVGAEWRRRASDRDTTAPYVELSGKYNYTENSFVVGGYAYTLDETSDVTRFNDTQVHRFFANIQHHVTALIVASGSFTYEPAELQGRRSAPVLGAAPGTTAPQKDIPEDTLRLGGALNYLANKNWVISASYDYDRIWSGINAREMKRNRFGLHGTYTF
jgi:hypothetical protein